MIENWTIRAAGITILLCLVYLALIGCSHPDPNAPTFDLSQLGETGDSLAMEQMVVLDHHRIRSELDSLLKNFIRNRAMAPDSFPDPSSLRLEWLVSQYTRITSIRDLSGRFHWAVSTTKRNAIEKIRLDSACSNWKARSAKVYDRGADNGLEEMLRAYRSIGDSSQVASILLKLTQAGLNSLPADSCLKLIDAGEQLCNAADLREVLGDFLFSKSKILAERKGDYFGSLAESYAGIKCFEQFGYRARIPRLRLQAGRDLLQLGLVTQAIGQFRIVGIEYAALPVESNGRIALSDQAIASNLMAECFYDLAELDSALSYANRSVQMQERLLVKGSRSDTVSMAYSVSTRGIIYQAKDRFGEAEVDLSKSHRLFVDCRDSEGLATNSFRRAALLIDESHFTQAEALFDSVLQLSDDPQNKLFSQFGKALVKYLIGDLNSSKQLSFRCIAELEAERELVLEPDLAVGFLSDKIGMYDLVIAMYLQQYKEHSTRSYLDSALLTLQRSKSRSLISILKRDRAEHISEERVSVPFSASRTSTAQSISHQVAVSDSLRISQLGPRNNSRTNRFGLEAPPRWHEPVAIPGHAYLDYFVSEFGVGLFVIAPDTTSFRPIELSLDSLKILAVQFASALSRYPLRSEPSEAIRTYAIELGLALVPFEFLRKNHISSLTIIPSGPLENIPFNALETPDSKYLVEEFEVSTVPSIEVSQLLASSRRENRAPLRLIALGDPLIDSLTKKSVSLYFGSFPDLRSLDFAQEELLEIKSIYKDAEFKALMQSEASKASLESQIAAGASVLHFATHGLVNSENPEFSALLLSSNPLSSDDGLLKATEIEQLKLDGPTVFLSACETASGTQYRGEGVYSLARSFLAAGANEVIATLWNVDDRSTVDMTREFYRSLREHSSASRALATAQRAMINSPRRLYRHPYFWSPFVHIGGGLTALP